MPRTQSDNDRDNLLVDILTANTKQTQSAVNAVIADKDLEIARLTAQLEIMSERLDDLLESPYAPSTKALANIRPWYDEIEDRVRENSDGRSVY